MHMKQGGGSVSQDIVWARAELTARKVIGPGPLPEISE